MFYLHAYHIPTCMIWFTLKLFRWKRGYTWEMFRKLCSRAWVSSCYLETISSLNSFYGSSFVRRQPYLFMYMLPRARSQGSCERERIEMQLSLLCKAQNVYYLASHWLLLQTPPQSMGFLLQENKDDSSVLLLIFTLPVDFILSHTYEKWDIYTRNNGNFKHCNTGANCNQPPYLVLHLRIQSTVVRSIFKCANTDHVQIFLNIVPEQCPKSIQHLHPFSY